VVTKNSARLTEPMTRRGTAPRGSGAR
jgi:hypothetical protein